MRILVVGGTGATGQLLVQQLLDREQEVRVIVRSVDRLPDNIRQHDKLTVIQANLSDLSDAELNDFVRECDAVASCLGHNLTFKGMYGQPRRLVTEAVRRLCQAIRANRSGKPVKFVLMNTSGNRNRDLAEKISFAQHIVIFLIRWLVPPHADNEQAAEYLRTGIGQQDADIEWAAVRPDTLINAHAVSPYELHVSPTRSAIFNAGQTSRINVAHFMAELITNQAAWNTWRGKMPVIYNTASSN